MSLVSKAFSKVDSYGRQVRLTIGKTDTVSTGLGGFFTIAALAATISLAAATISNYLHHMSPSISFQYDYFPDPGGLELNSSNFLFSITNQDADFFLDSAMVSFNMIYVVQKRLPNGSYVRDKYPIPLVKCTREYWKGFEADYDMQNMGNRLCPSIDQYNITGTFLSWEYVYIQLEVQKCKNRTDQPDIICKPQDELDAILPGKDIAVSLMYTDNIFNLNDWQNPVKRYVTSLHWNIAPEVLSKKTDVFISQYDIITDDNYLLEGYWESNYSTFQVNAEERNQNYAPEASDIYMKIYLRKSSSFTTATRLFLKAGDVLESLGGLSGFWFALFGVIAMIYNKKIFEVKMANSLYEFDKNYDSKPKPQNKKGIGEKNHSEITTNKNLPDVRSKKGRLCGPVKDCCNSFRNCLRRMSCRKTNSKKTSASIQLGQKQIQSARALKSVERDNKAKATDKVKLYLKSFQNYSKGFGKKMTYNFWDFIAWVLCCGRRKKDRLISLAAERLQEDTDITQILKRLQDLEKLKTLFFNEHQRRVFSYTRPPLISLEDHKLICAPPATKQSKAKAKEKAKEPRRSFLRNSIEILKLRRKNLLQKDPFEDVDSISKFALIFDSYRKLRRAKNKINKELLRQLDSDVEEVLYNLDFDLKVDSTFSNEYFKIMAIRVFEDLFFEAKRKTKKLSKEDAANIIARKWLSASRKRKARDVKKVTRMILLSKKDLNPDHPDMMSAEDTSKKEDLGSLDRDDDILQEYEREDPLGSVEEEGIDFDDDEILNDLYNYEEDIEDLQTPKVAVNKPNNVRLIETGGSYPPMRSREDSRLEIHTHLTTEAGEAMLSNNEKKKTRFG